MYFGEILLNIGLFGDTKHPSVFAQRESLIFFESNGFVAWSKIFD